MIKPVAQAPHHLRAHDRDDPDQKINDAQKRNEQENAGVREGDPDKVKNSLDGAEDHERACDLIDERGAAKENSDAAKCECAHANRRLEFGLTAACSSAGNLLTPVHCPRDANANSCLFSA